MKRFLLVLAAPLLMLSMLPVQQPNFDEQRLVKDAVKDYVDALYLVQPELLDRSVHPSLVKRGFYRPKGEEDYQPPALMTLEELKSLAARWNVDNRVGEDLPYTIHVEKVFDRTASARLVAYWGIDHMQLMKVDGKWKIIHILWQSKPQTR